MNVKGKWCWWNMEIHFPINILEAIFECEGWRNVKEMYRLKFFNKMVVKKSFLTCVNVVRCLRRAGVGQDAGVWPEWPVCGKVEMPLPGDEILPDTDEIPLFGSGFSFLKAPSAFGNAWKRWTYKIPSNTVSHRILSCKL